MTLEQLIERVTCAGGRITFDYGGDRIRVSAHKPADTPVTCGMLYQPGDAHFAPDFAQLLETNGFFR